jgi:tetratricopeptide (TPR) repeat protein
MAIRLGFASLKLATVRPQKYGDDRMNCQNLIKFLIFPFLLFLSGCIAFGVPATSNPDKLIREAYQMMNQRRPIPARRFIEEALEKYQEQGNETGVAEAYFTFGNYYKNANMYVDLDKSEENFRKALDIYKKHNDYEGIVKSHFGIGNVFQVKGSMTKACEEYNESLSNFEKGAKADPSFIKTINIRTGFKDVPEMINGFKANIGCK